jgi:hypothetical protein
MVKNLNSVIKKLPLFHSQVEYFKKSLRDKPTASVIVAVLHASLRKNCSKNFWTSIFFQFACQLNAPLEENSPLSRNIKI